MCDRDLKCCLQSPKEVEPGESYGVLRRGQSPRARAESGVGFPGSQEEGAGSLSASALKGCRWEAHRKLPTGLDHSAQLSPGALEKVLKVTAGETHRTWLSCGPLSQGTTFVIPAFPISMGSSLLLQPPGCSLLQQGHSSSSSRLGTRVWQ